MWVWRGIILIYYNLYISYIYIIVITRLDILSQRSSCTKSVLCVFRVYSLMLQVCLQITIWLRCQCPALTNDAFRWLNIDSNKMQNNQFTLTQYALWKWELHLTNSTSQELRLWPTDYFKILRRTGLEEEETRCVWFTRPRIRDHIPCNLDMFK